MVMVTDSICFAVYRDRIYVEESARGFLIAVFDGSGKKLYEIKKDIEARKITEEDKKAIFKNFKEDSFVNLLAKSQGGWENFKKTREFIYPHTFPAIKDLIVTGGRIYVSTYETRDNKEKYIIMDLKGKILSTPYMPVPQESSFVSKTLGRGNRFYGIVDNTYYYLQENEENEEWELHVTDIK